MFKLPFAPWMKTRALALALLALLPLFWLSSCSSSAKIRGIPDKLPPIALSGTVRTPPHRMQSHEYPFDSGGRYVSEWAAEGERRSGRSAAASASDEKKWTGSHGGAATGRKIVIASKSKKSTPSRSTAKSKSKSGGSSYVVKKGDTLSSIARSKGTSVSKLKAANGLKSDFLSIGKVLRIPG
jgi:hypothetical protein